MASWQDGMLCDLLRRVENLEGVRGIVAEANEHHWGELARYKTWVDVPGAAMDGHTFFSRVPKNSDGSGYYVVLPCEPMFHGPLASKAPSWMLTWAQYHHFTEPFDSKLGKYEAILKTAKEEGAALSKILWCGNALADFKGIRQWIPEEIPYSTPLTTMFGVNRSANVNGLMGWRYVCKPDQAWDDAVLSMLTMMARENARTGEVFVGPETMKKFRAILKTKDGEPCTMLHPARDSATFVEDTDCPEGYAYALDMQSWILVSMKPVPHVLTELDEVDCEYANNSLTAKVGAYLQLGCKAPWRNGVVKLN